jgi:hypothetical protein
MSKKLFIYLIIVIAAWIAVMSSDYLEQVKADQQKNIDRHNKANNLLNYEYRDHTE